MIIILQLIVLILNIIQTRYNNTRKMLVFTLLANTVTFFTYFVNNNYVGAVIYSITVIRSILYVYKDKFRTNITCYIMITFQIIIAVLTIDSYFEILNITAGIYSCYYMWFYKTPQQFRAGFIVNNVLRLAYETINGLYILAIMRTCSIISAVYNIVKSYIRDKQH